MSKNITTTMFEKIEQGIFAFGFSTDSEDGLFMANTGKVIYWVAVKGIAGDWCMYCGFEPDIDELVCSGDKVLSESNIRKVLAVSDEMMRLYRY